MHDTANSSDEFLPSNDKTPEVWRGTVSIWVSALIFGLLLISTFYAGLAEMVRKWSVSEEYGYGYIIPIVVIFFIWQKKNQLERIRFKESWGGIVLVILGLALLIIGYLSTLFIIIQYSFLIVLYGAVLAVIGWRGLKEVWVPLLLLFFMIPLPVFLYQNLSSSLQLISSEFGVAILKLFNISVYLEGNVIDLGTYKLQVVEACSGLRYLFPLASLAFIAAYMFKAAFWKRALVFLSSIPISIAMNSIRIGAIGILVEFWGIEMAEGFLHYFEGWVIFMACMAILFLEIWVLTNIGRHRRAFHDAFNLEFPATTPSDATVNRRELPKSLLIIIAILGAVLWYISSIDQRNEYIPPRTEFSEFPMSLGEWNGKPDRLEQIYLDVLKLEDHVLADYRNNYGKEISFYVAYYDSQRKGESAHSPRSCLPGGGWKITDFSRETVDDVYLGGMPLRVNRTVIKQGDFTQLVYYWFQQRGRMITSEYLVKWFLFWDALTQNRTDGALVRLTTIVGPRETLEEGDVRLTDFAKSASHILNEYIPD